MRPTELKDYLQFTINNNFPMLIKGAPGIGKSDIVEQTAEKTGAKLIISHPVVSDPTDYKGLPFPTANGKADFLPYGDLDQIMSATEKTIFFLDDLGQASPSVQAACMQLLLARRINGHKVSDLVTFVAATNRREDKAAVTGLLEPVKSRFISIIQLDAHADDWILWAYDNKMPLELIAFIQWQPDIIKAFKPSKDLINSVCPRTIAAVGKQQAANLPEIYQVEAFTGAAGEDFARAYIAFLSICNTLPMLENILKNPKSASIPSDPSTLYAVTCSLANKMNDENIDRIFIYLKRLPEEMSAACVQGAAAKNKNICNNHAFINWTTQHAKLVS